MDNKRIESIETRLDGNNISNTSSNCYNTSTLNDISDCILNNNLSIKIKFLKHKKKNTTNISTAVLINNFKYYIL